MHQLDDNLKVLVAKGQEQGFLTFSQVNDYLPDEAINPEKLDQLLMVLEDHGIELIDESEAEEREAGPEEAARQERQGCESPRRAGGRDLEAH